MCIVGADHLSISSCNRPDLHVIVDRYSLDLRQRLKGFLTPGEQKRAGRRDLL